MGAFGSSSTFVLLPIVLGLLLGGAMALDRKWPLAWLWGYLCAGLIAAAVSLVHPLPGWIWPSLLVFAGVGLVRRARRRPGGVGRALGAGVWTLLGALLAMPLAAVLGMSIASPGGGPENALATLATCVWLIGLPVGATLGFLRWRSRAGFADDSVAQSGNVTAPSDEFRR